MNLGQINESIGGLTSDRLFVAGVIAPTPTLESMIGTSDEPEVDSLPWRTGITTGCPPWTHGPCFTVVEDDGLGKVATGWIGWERNMLSAIGALSDGAVVETTAGSDVMTEGRVWSLGE